MNPLFECRIFNEVPNLPSVERGIVLITSVVGESYLNSKPVCIEDYIGLPLVRISKSGELRSFTTEGDDLFSAVKLATSRKV
jgi:hypothetical protein